MATRKPSAEHKPTPKEMEKAHETWLENFEGAMLKRLVTLKTPTVAHFFRRSFAHFGKNAHYITVYGRILLGESQIAIPEKAISDQLSALKTNFERQVAMSKAAVSDASIVEIASYNAPSIEAVIFVPAQRRLLEILLLADEKLTLMHSLWLNGDIPEQEKPKAELETKQQLRTIVGLSRRLRNLLREQVSKKAKGGDVAAAAALHEDESINKDEDQEDLDAAAGINLPVIPENTQPTKTAEVAAA